MALHLVTAQKSLNFRQLSSFWMVVQGKTITRTCCLAWLWGGTQLHSSGSREEHKAEALPCSAKEMNHWTALLELLALNCLYRAITVRVCACVHTYMATLFSTSLSFLITTLWTGKSSYSPNCSITVGITSLYFDWGPIWFSGLGSIIWESTSRKKKSLWNNGNSLLRKLQNWLNLAFPRFEALDNWQIPHLPLSSGVWLSCCGAPGGVEISITWATGQLLFWAGLAENCSSWQPHGEIPGLPRNLQACYASLFSLHFIRVYWDKYIVDKKNQSQDQAYCRKPLCYTIPDTSALHQYCIVGNVQHETGCCL